MSKISKSLLTLILFSIFGLFINTSFSAQFSNCTNCDSGTGTILGNINPVDPYFYPQAFYFRCKNWKSGSKLTLGGYYNSNYFYAARKKTKRIRLFIGYKSKENNFIVEGIERNFLCFKTPDE